MTEEPTIQEGQTELLDPLEQHNALLTQQNEYLLAQTEALQEQARGTKKISYATVALAVMFGSIFLCYGLFMCTFIGLGLMGALALPAS